MKQKKLFFVLLVCLFFSALRGQHIYKDSLSVISNKLSTIKDIPNKDTLKAKNLISHWKENASSIPHPPITPVSKKEELNMFRELKK
ncbi:MAG: hypothetical protein N2Z72_00535 [Bacteroidales bacterium]|nr:hypothetical protein [Bacteroidales bacterium]